MIQAAHLPDHQEVAQNPECGEVLLGALDGQAIVADRAGPGRCTKLLPIKSLLQYRFATPKPLPTRPGSEGCTTVPFCKWAELHDDADRPTAGAGG